MGRHQARTDLGREFGATDVVSARGEEGIALARELTGGEGTHVVLECVGNMPAYDRLNPPLAVRIDERYERFDGRSSSAAKRADAAFKISFARRGSAFSAFRRLISAASSEVTPGRRPASTSALRTQVRTVSAAPIPSFAATAFVAAHSVG
ncbi:zinc-binding dehydrogenase [Streptomyces scabiei]|uniref:Zinc-binding dehydrogenase n=1 Tax=Streptomyces scabiei TaxID=1930 RepID=A0A124C4R5_STRSC|nr:zinc-binding dehydrogenase [Streptomyces scabiei]